MNITLKKSPADIIAGLTTEANQCLAEIAELQAAIPVKEARINSLALAIRQGNLEAVAEVATLRAEIADARDAIRMTQAAESQLRALVADETQAEQKRSDKHLRRKSNKGIQTLPAIVKDMERHLNGFVKCYAALHAAAEPISTAWRAGWPAKPTILYEHSINRLIGHAVFIALRANNIKLPEIKFSEREFPGLHKYWIASADGATAALLADEVPGVVELLEPEPVQAAPVSQEPPHVFTDEEIAQNNRLNNPRGWPLSGGEYVKMRDHANAQLPTMPRDTDPWTGQELDI